MQIRAETFLQNPEKRQIFPAFSVKIFLNDGITHSLQISLFITKTTNISP